MQSAWSVGCRVPDLGSDAAAEQAEMEREKIHWEEMRKTQHQQSQTKAQLARYEDELARKRMEVRAALSLSLRDG